MPPIPVANMAMVLRAVLAFVAFEVTIMTAVTVVGFSIDYYNNGSIDPPLPPPKHSMAVEFDSNSGYGSCPTCLLVNSDDDLLDYLGSSLHFDVQNLRHNTPTPTMPLKTSYAAPFILQPKPTPTPPATPEVLLPLVPTFPTPASAPFSNPIVPPPGASKFEILLIRCQNLLRHMVDILHSTDVPISRVTKQQASGTIWVIVCGMTWAILATAMTNFLLHRLNFRKSYWTKFEGLSKVTSSQGIVRLASKEDQSLETLMAILRGNSADPNTLVLAIHRHMVNYINDEEARRAEWRAVEKAKLNRMANREFKRLKQVHQNKLDATYERDVFATANIEPSFGPSLRNAEAELRRRLGRAMINEGSREEIVGIFKGVLYTFTYAIAVEESKPEGRNERFRSVIDRQNNLIACLRLLHEYREKAYFEKEELIRSLCQYNNENGDLIVPYGEEGRHPWDKYSAKYDTFIMSPPDGPTALSAKVSLSSAPLLHRPDSELEFDPHLQRFLRSIAQKMTEQEARDGTDVRELDVGRMEDTVQESPDVSQIHDEEYPNEDKEKENNASKETHHDGPQNELVDLEDGDVEFETGIPSAMDFAYLSDAELSVNPQYQKWLYWTAVEAEQQVRGAAADGEGEERTGIEDAVQQNDADASQDQDVAAQVEGEERMGIQDAV